MAFLLIKIRILFIFHIILYRINLQQRKNIFCECLPECFFHALAEDSKLRFPVFNFFFFKKQKAYNFNSEVLKCLHNLDTHISVWPSANKLGTYYQPQFTNEFSLSRMGSKAEKAISAPVQNRLLMGINLHRLNRKLEELLKRLTHRNYELSYFYSSHFPLLGTCV